MALVLASALENKSETQDGEKIDVNTKYDGTSKRPVVGSPVGFAPENEDDHDYGDVTVQTAMNDYGTRVEDERRAAAVEAQRIREQIRSDRNCSFTRAQPEREPEGAEQTAHKA